MHAQKLFGSKLGFTIVVSAPVRSPKENCKRCRGAGILGVNKATGETHHCTCTTRVRA